VTRTINWDAGHPVVLVLDQTRLPHDVVTVRWCTVDDAARGIESMQVRGAPLIGVAAAYGVALAMASDPSDVGLRAAVDRLARTRPTAANLRWALARCEAALAAVVPPDREQVSRQLADQLAGEDVAACRAIGDAGLALLERVAAAQRDPARPLQVLTHCNAGRLAAVEWGTALAPVYRWHADGRPVHVWVSETRPRNQGAALTAWELADAGVPYTVIADNASGHLLRQGLVDVCLVGADRVAANGDVVNKVGTYLKALAARDNGVPFYVAAPTSTIDPATPTGAAVTIEERDPNEVTRLGGVELVPTGTAARNWAFDVTPAALVGAIVTERGVVPADAAGLASLR
jgi:methylthioribose-1-phosphate isomerase